MDTTPALMFMMMIPALTMSIVLGANAKRINAAARARRAARAAEKG